MTFVEYTHDLLWRLPQKRGHFLKYAPGIYFVGYTSDTITVAWGKNVALHTHIREAEGAASRVRPPSALTPALLLSLGLHLSAPWFPHMSMGRARPTTWQWC